MELRRLRYFLEVSREGSLGRASRSTGVAQPALGRQIQLLESELGVQLFERFPRGMRLTDEGEYLRAALDHPLQQLDLALSNVSSYSTRIEASLTMGLPPSIAQLLGPRLFLRFATELPRLKLHIHERSSMILAGDLSRGIVDVAVLASVTPESRIFHGRVMRDDVMLVGPPGSIDTDAGQVRFADLERYALIVPAHSDGLHAKLQKLALHAGTKLAVRSEIESPEVVKAIVKSGGGYAILPPIAFRAEAARGELTGARIVDPSFTRSIFFAVQPNWRMPRSIWNEIERILFEEWIACVDEGAWPGTWLLDRKSMARPAGADRGA